MEKIISQPEQSDSLISQRSFVGLRAERSLESERVRSFSPFRFIKADVISSFQQNSCITMRSVNEKIHQRPIALNFAR